MTGGLEEGEGDQGWAVRGEAGLIGRGRICFEISFLFLFLHFE